MADELEAPQDPGATDELQVPEGHVLVAVGDLPENFKTEQALIDSYKESQRKISELGERASRAERAAEEERLQREQLMEMFQQQPQQQPVAQDQFANNPLVAYAYQQLLEGDPAPYTGLVTQLATAQALEQMQQNQPQNEPPQQDLEALAVVAADQLRSKYGDEFDDVLDGTFEYLNQLPPTQMTTLAQVRGQLETAFRFAHHDKLLRGHQEQQTAAQKAEAEKEAARQRKLNEQTLSGAGPRPAPPDESQAAWERIKNAQTGGLRIPTS